MADLTTITDVFDYTQYNRVGRVELLHGGQPISWMNTKGLNFRFKYEQRYIMPPDNMVPTATVEILGLNQTSVDYLCEFMTTPFFSKREVSVKVYAGYDPDGTGDESCAQLLFHMPVIRATPSAYPENWVTLDCAMQYGKELVSDYQWAYQDINGKGISAREMCNRIEEYFDLAFLWHADSEKEADKEEHYVTAFGFNGGAEAAVDALREKFSFLRFEHTRNASHNGRPCVYDIRAREPKKDDKGVGLWQIDREHGMIGVPSFIGGTSEQKKITARTLLNPRIIPWDRIDLASYVARDLNGRYRVMTVAHSGELRGNEWYTTIEGLAENALAG